MISTSVLFCFDPWNGVWGALLSVISVLVLKLPGERQLSIDFRYLRAIRLGLLHIQSLLLDQMLAIFLSSSIAFAYLRKHEGTVSLSVDFEAQLTLRWAGGEVASR